jgi:hypothetical protein
VEEKTPAPHSFPSDWIPTRIDKCNEKIMIAIIRDPDLFRVENYFASKGANNPARVTSRKGAGREFETDATKERKRV